MKTLRTTEKYIFSKKDVALLATLALTNTVIGALLMKRSYFEGWHDYKETFVEFKPHK